MDDDGLVAPKRIDRKRNLLDLAFIALFYLLYQKRLLEYALFRIASLN